MIRFGDRYIFECTGRQVNDFNMVWEASNDKEWEVTYGYDGRSDFYDNNGVFEFDTILTKEEKVEMAIHMINHWKKFAGIQ